MRKLYFVLIGILVFLTSCALLEDKSGRIEEAIDRFEIGCKGDIPALESITTDDFCYYLNGQYGSSRQYFIESTKTDPMPSDWAFVIGKKYIYDKTADVDILISISSYPAVISFPAKIGLEDKGDMMASRWMVNRFDIILSTGTGTSDYSLTSSVNPVGAGSVALNPAGGTYTAGTQVTLTATPNSGYIFSSWSGGASGTNVTTTVTVTSNMSVTANFTNTGGNTYTLNALISPSGSGSVSFNPAGGTYNSGTIVTLTATANSGYVFSSWTGGASGTSYVTTVLVTANTTVTANFTIPVNYTLMTSVSPSGAGSVNLSPAGGTYVSGTVVTLSATANSGYAFSSWTGNITGTISPATIVMNGNKNITANFYAAVGQLFSDDFESWATTKGTWDSVTNDAGNIITPETTYSNSQIKSLHTKVNASTLSPYLTKSFSPGAPRYVRFYVYLPVPFANIFAPMYIYSANNRRIVFIIDANGELMLQGDLDWTGVFHAATLTKGAWHRIEIMAPTIPSAAAVVRWWLDGVELTPLTDDFNDAGTTWNSIRFGIVSTIGNIITEDAYFDDFVVSDSMIGP